MQIKGKLETNGELLLGSDTKIYKDNNKVKVDTNNEKTTQINKDTPLKWYINNFITDGDEINSSPSTNGYTAGQQFAINDSGHNYNGNIYRVKDNDTWELLDNKYSGLGIFNQNDKNIYFYSSDDINGEWKISGLDEKVKVDATDNQAQYLSDKLEYDYFDTNKHISKGFMINNDYSEVKKRALNPRISADIVVENIAELDAALDEVATSGIGKVIFLSAGTYDKGSHFYIPAVDNITLKGGGAKLIRPTNDDLFVCQDGTVFRGLIIDGLKFYGEDNNNYVYIKLSMSSSYTQYARIINCNFYENGYDYIQGAGYQVIIQNNIFQVGAHNRSSNINVINMNGGNVGTCIIEDNTFYIGGPSGSCQAIRLNGGSNQKNQILNNKINWSDINIYDNACIYCKKENNASAGYFNIIKNNEIFLHENRATDYIIKSDVNAGRIQISDNVATPTGTIGVGFTNISDNGGTQRVFNNIILQ